MYTIAGKTSCSICLSVPGSLLITVYPPALPYLLFDPPSEHPPSPSTDNVINLSTPTDYKQLLTAEWKETSGLLYFLYMHKLIADQVVSKFKFKVNSLKLGIFFFFQSKIVWKSHSEPLHDLVCAPTLYQNMSHTYTSWPKPF
jgi:hypothetical protein